MRKRCDVFCAQKNRCDFSGDFLRFLQQRLRFWMNSAFCKRSNFSATAILWDAKHSTCRTKGVSCMDTANLAKLRSSGLSFRMQKLVCLLYVLVVCLVWGGWLCGLWSGETKPTCLKHAEIFPERHGKVRGLRNIHRCFGSPICVFFACFVVVMVLWLLHYGLAASMLQY